MRRLRPRTLVIVLAFCTLAVLRTQPLGAGDSFHGQDFYSAKEFHAWCQSAEPRDQRACEAYICGVLDAWSMQSQVLHSRPYSFCLPVGSTCRHLSELVTDYLTKDPTALRFAGSSAVAYPLVKMFPCLISG